MKLTNAIIQSLPEGDHLDSELKGFGVRVQAKKKPLFFIRFRGYKESFAGLGSYPTLSCEAARRSAQQKLIEGPDQNRKDDFVFNFRIFLEKNQTLPFAVKKSFIPFLLQYVKDFKIQDMTPKTVKILESNSIKELGKRNSQKLIATIKAFYKKMLTSNKVPKKSPAARIPKLKEDLKSLTSKNIKLILESIAKEKSPYKQFYFTLLYTEALPQELINLLWNDVHENYIEIFSPKQPSRKIPLNDSLRVEINTLSKVSKYVFAEKKEGLMQGHHQSWKRILKRAQLHEISLEDIKERIPQFLPRSSGT